MLNVFVLCTPPAPASLKSRGPEGLEAKWTLKRVQGDGALKSALGLQTQPSGLVQSGHDVEVLNSRAARAFAEIVEHGQQPHLRPIR